MAVIDATPEDITPSNIHDAHDFTADTFASALDDWDDLDDDDDSEDDGEGNFLDHDEDEDE